MVNLGLLVLRIVSGVGIAVFHGWDKVIGMIRFLSGKEWKFVDTVASVGLPVPGLFAILTGVIEFAGGILVAVGLFTRFSAGLLVAVMVGAVYYAVRTSGVYELALLYLAVFVSLVFAGGGDYSLDKYLRKTKQ